MEKKLEGIVRKWVWWRIRRAGVGDGEEGEGDEEGRILWRRVQRGIFEAEFGGGNRGKEKG